MESAIYTVHDQKKRVSSFFMYTYHTNHKENKTPTERSQVTKLVQSFWPSYKVNQRILWQNIIKLQIFVYLKQFLRYNLTNRKRNHESSQH